MEKKINISNQYLEELRQVGDHLADVAFIQLKAEPTLVKKFYSISNNSAFLSLKFDGDFHAFHQDLVTQYNAINLDELKLGQAFFTKYTSEIMGMLGYYSLPYCYAGAKGVRVLHHSKKIKENPEKRLIETAQFVFDVSQKGSFDLNERALLSIAKVRLMHAAARHYTKSFISDEMPVNQEDLLATLLSFSLISLRGLRKIGIDVSKEESYAFINMWNHIGRLMGINADILPHSIQEASMVERMMRKRQFKYSIEGEELTMSLVNFLASQDIPGIKINPKTFMSFLLGPEVSANVGLKGVSTVEQNIFGNLVRIRSFFEDFSKNKFENVKQQFEKNLKDKNMNVDFKAV